jgi:CubicO group peptidase (beta-lactamase class C family)
MTFEDMLLYTTNNNEEAIITVGIIQNGKTSYTIYGKNGITLPQSENIYEIGSITKIFTASLLFKAINEGKIKLDDNIDKYLKLPKKNYYPTIRRLITHTSGYKSYYFEGQMVSNFFHRRNDFYCISNAQLIERIGKISLKNRDYGFNYSNFGIAVIGSVLSEIYGDDYAVLMNRYLLEELELDKTKISDGLGNLNNYWDWAEKDAYASAGSLTSNIEDMLKYAQLQINETFEYFSNMHESFVEIDSNSARNKKMNIHMDAIGATWIIDNHNNIIWHNGGTSHFNSYIGFDTNKKNAVVILSNLPPNYRIPATVMGIRLLKDL